MSSLPKRSGFSDSAEGLDAKQRLIVLAEDNRFQTDASYSANGEKYPNHSIPFVDKHMKYLSEHQSVNVDYYLSNLRLMTRIK